MNNFTIIYKILSAIEKSMEYEIFDKEMISAKTLGISEIRLIKILKMLIDENYITGITVKHTAQGSYINFTDNISLTIKGLEYLEQNSMMKKAYNTLKGVKDTIPFI